ncbi:MAG: hypothetical protein HUN04_11830 [Desulfobacter sp.]|nr:MAG: hypothetical protein HUN04_07490 [Desulfobacter sp.]WDP90347.1 MAG: hypothetical protein HUN04_11830 [Desulfobacter sp.]
MITKIETNFYSLFVYENILYIQITASWDADVVKRQYQDYLYLTDKYFKDNKWCQIVEFVNDVLPTPDGIEEMMKFMGGEGPEPKANHLMHVVGDSLLKDGVLKEVFKSAIWTEVEHFKTMKDALKKAKSIGYDISEF